MTFLHEDPEFDQLVEIVADARGIRSAIVEKDYWVTHVLWWLSTSGLEIWFKGGTSLSKGFGLIHRFSEDLDLKIDPGAVSGLPTVSNWRGDNKGPVQQRKDYFSALADRIRVPGTTRATIDTTIEDKYWRNARVIVEYPGKHLAGLGPLSPYILLEVGPARVTPAVTCSLTSWVHDHVEVLGTLANYTANRPSSVPCVHPLVTLLEKLDALHRRVPNENAHPRAFVRHYEDAAHIIRSIDSLPVLAEYGNARALAEDMLANRQLVSLPRHDDPAFELHAGRRTDAIRESYEAIAPIFWGPRLRLDEACAVIRGWISNQIERTS